MVKPLLRQGRVRELQAAQNSCGRGAMAGAADAGEFDYIIVGAGSAGCALANRLSADGRHAVLLLEAGPPDTYPWIRVPIGYAKTMFNPSVNWCFKTEPEPQMNGRQVYW